MKRHGTFTKLLALRRSLAPEEDAKLTRHLMRCRSCRELAGEYKRQDAFLQSLELPSPTPQLRRVVFDRIDRPVAYREPRRADGDVRPYRRGRRRRLGLRLAPAALALALAATLVHVTTQPSGAPSAQPAATSLKFATQQRPAEPPAFAPATDASSYRRPNAAAVQTVAGGLMLTLSIARTAYAKNALVPVTVRLKNVSRHSVRIAPGGTPCATPAPWAEVTTVRGNVLYPPPFQGDFVPECARPEPERSLAAGETILSHFQVILRDRYLRAVVAIPSLCGCRTVTSPTAMVHFVPETIPRNHR